MNPFTVRIRLGIPEDAPEGKYLFNQVRFLKHQPCAQPVLFEVLHKQQVLAFIYLFLQDGIAVSPCRATFGSVEYLAKVPPEALDLLLTQMGEFVRHQSLAGIRIVSYPFCYAPETSQLLTAALLRNGFTIRVADENYHIPVSQEAFQTNLHHSARRRLEKCRNTGFTFSEQPASFAGEAHHFIKTCRERRGFPMTMEVDSFERMFEQLPGVYHIFTIRHQTEVVALTVTVRINEHILYNFYPADHAQYHTFSPTVMLTAELYAYAQANGFQVLDLGIATDLGVPNYGLIRFKRNLGALPSLKLTFERLLG